MKSMYFPRDDQAAMRAVGLLIKDDPDRLSSSNYAMSLRLPLKLAAYVAVMASAGGVSRNEMACLIVGAGVEEILSRLSDPERAEIESGIEEQIHEFITD